MKLATWNWTTAAVMILLSAGSLRAQAPNVNAHSAASVNKYSRLAANAQQTSPWQDYGAEPEQIPTPASRFGGSAVGGPVGGATVDGPVLMEGERLVTEGEMLMDGEVIGEGPVFPYTSGNWWKNGHWYAASDFVVWHRTKPFGLILGFDDSFDVLPPPQPNIPGFAVPELNKSGGSLGVAPGNRTTIGYMLMRDLDNRDHSVEATYLGFGEWDSQDGLISFLPRRLLTALDLNADGYANADFYDIFYTSQFHSLEVNYRIRNRPGRDRMIMGPDGFWSRQLAPGPTQSLTLGIRGLTIDESFRWVSGRFGVSQDVFGGDMDITTDNNLLGVQFGGDFIGVHESWFWGVRGNAGIYCNFAEGHYRLVGNDGDDSTFIQNQAHSQNAAFFGEFSFMAGANVTDNVVLRASWDMALAGGLVLAPDQASFDTYMAANIPSLNDGGQIFYTGLSLGVEAYW